MTSRLTADQIRAAGRAEGVLAALLVTDGPNGAAERLAVLDADELREVVIQAVMWLGMVTVRQIHPHRHMAVINRLAGELRAGAEHVARTDGQYEDCQLGRPHAMEGEAP